jgi:omega-6 fatty acid desaturase (delta-12 desaturase)
MAAVVESATREGISWGRRLAAYRTPSALRAIGELAITVIPFALAWTLMYVGLSRGQWWLYALALPFASGLLVRLFLIQHDCGHRAFFASRSTNDWIGRLASILTLTPYDHWRSCHAIHHGTSGDLARRGVGDVDTLTVAEYVARSRWHRFRYRFYRHPLVLFGIGPTWLFILQNRIPAGFMRGGWKPWASTMGTNLAVAVCAGAMIATIGVWPFLLVHVPIVLLGAAAGVWLFYVQHQFEQTYWATGDAWNVHEAALHGSSHYDLPPVLRWFTANIGVHHVHHLSSLIPYYRLQDVLRDHPELHALSRLSLRQSLRCVRLVLWDEPARRLITFRELRLRAAA